MVTYIKFLDSNPDKGSSIPTESEALGHDVGRLGHPALSSRQAPKAPRPLAGNGSLQGFGLR